MLGSSSSSSDDDDIIILALLMRRRRRRRARERRWQVHPINALRQEQGAHQHLIAELREDEDRFQNFHHLTINQFDTLLMMVEPHISKMYYRREPLSPGLKLSLTLRFLASGDSMVSLTFLYRIGRSTVSGIIQQVCGVIWDILQPLVLTWPSQDDFTRVAKDFEELWKFPNCIGAIGDKRVICQCPPNSGSSFFNYTKTFSTVLMATCDAHYRFTYVSVGSAGRQSDAGIFQASDLYEALENKTVPLPPPSRPPRSTVRFPPVIVGDAAFPLKQYLMCPYPGANLPPEEEIFNYRLSRATRIIEDTFGVLASRWRIYRRRIIACPETIDKVVKCTVVLHNWLRDEEMHIPAGRRRYIPVDLADRLEAEGRWREEGQPEALCHLARNDAHNATDTAKNLRKEFTRYFMEEGHVPWQWEKLPAHLQEVHRQHAVQITNAQR